MVVVVVVVVLAAAAAALTASAGLAAAAATATAAALAAGAAKLACLIPWRAPPCVCRGRRIYIYIYLVNMDVNGVYDQLITWGEYFTDVESFNPIDLAMNQYI